VSDKRPQALKLLIDSFELVAVLVARDQVVGHTGDVGEVGYADRERKAVFARVAVANEEGADVERDEYLLNGVARYVRLVPEFVDVFQFERIHFGDARLH